MYSCCTMFPPSKLLLDTVFNTYSPYLTHTPWFYTPLQPKCNISAFTSIRFTVEGSGMQVRKRCFLGLVRFMFQVSVGIQLITNTRSKQKRLPMCFLFRPHIRLCTPRWSRASLLPCSSSQSLSDGSSLTNHLLH